ncbi:MAG TPA: hypothetical protein VHG35_09015 [Gemmatimonadales bacterium]|nr:hypothetical protein [Gemmatimonadales bacterium]
MSELNRREFTETVAMAALAPLLVRGVAPIPDSHPAVHDPRTLAEALARAVRAQYGDRLSETDLAAVARQIEAMLDRAEKIRRVPLANGDEPDFVFTAVRSPDLG